MPSPEDRLAAPVAAAPRAVPRVRRHGWGSRVLAGVRGIFAMLTVTLALAVGAAGLIAWSKYQEYAADLPSLDGLRTYQPLVMSRIYAGDDRLIAELASERRIFVPLAA